MLVMVWGNALNNREGYSAGFEAWKKQLYKYNTMELWNKAEPVGSFGELYS